MTTEGYFCLECGAKFAHPRHYREVGDDNIPFDEWDGCPVCNGVFALLRVCDNCGNYITGDYYYKLGTDVYCEDCVQQCSVAED